MTDYVSLEGPVELEGDQLVLRIPLQADGEQLAPFAKGIGTVEGEDLVVVIQPWLATLLKIGAGSLVCVDNANGKFNLTRSGSNDAGGDA
jgi:hypothetical protein